MTPWTGSMREAPPGDPGQVSIDRPRPGEKVLDLLEGGAAQDAAEQDVVGDPRLAPVVGGDQGVRGQADAGGAESRLRQEPRLDDRDGGRVRPLPDVQEDGGAQAVGLPVPVLPEQDLACAGGLRPGKEGRALGRGRGPEPKHDLGADVEGEDVVSSGACAIGDAVDLGENVGVEAADDGPERLCVLDDARPLQAGVVLEDAAVELEGPVDPLPGLASDGPAPPVGVGLIHGDDGR